MIKFNDNNIYVGQIKQLLHEFNLPQCEIYNENNFYEENQLVIKDNSICKKIEDTFVPVTSYKFGDFILNITKNLEIRNTIYDTYTHKYLGNFLRFLRDYKHLNLMSMYNCFTYESPRRLNINIENKDTFSTKDELNNIFIVPVALDTDYTIALDYHGEISICCAFYDESKQLIIDDSKQFVSKSYMKKYNLRFNKPFLYHVPKNIYSSALNKYKKSLYMIIKIPKTCKSSVVILEGNYLANCEYVINEKTQQLGDKLFEYKHDNVLEGNYDYKCKLQLLSLNTQSKYLLADRLLEYLSENVINKLDTIDNNIKKLQIKMYDLKLIPYIKIFGVFDDDMRKSLYSFSFDKNIINTKFDLTGYCDKDIESNLGGIEMSKEWKTIKSTGGIN